MQVFRCWDLIHLNIVCVQIETVLSLIRANWMLWLLEVGSIGGCVTQPPIEPTSNQPQHPIRSN